MIINQSIGVLIALDAHLKKAHKDIPKLNLQRKNMI